MPIGLIENKTGIFHKRQRSLDLPPLSPTAMNEKHSDKEFATRAVWSGTQNIEGAAVTPIFNTATYQLTDERYAGWAAGAQHTSLY